MTAAGKYVFYFLMLLYFAYNLFWVAGMMFSFSANDTRMELIFFALTFLADVPILWWTRRNPRLGTLSFIGIAIASLWLASLQGVLNGFALSYWYAPKLIPWIAALWAAPPNEDYTQHLRN